MRSRIFLFLSCFQRGAWGVDHGAWFQNLGQRIFVGHFSKAYQGGKVLTGDQSAGVHREHAAHMAGLHCIWHGRDHE
jgi:hypothetical protein